MYIRVICFKVVLIGLRLSFGLGVYVCVFSPFCHPKNVLYSLSSV